MGSLFILQIMPDMNSTETSNESKKEHVFPNAVQDKAELVGSCGLFIFEFNLIAPLRKFVVLVFVRSSFASFFLCLSLCLSVPLSVSPHSWY